MRKAKKKVAEKRALSEDVLAKVVGGVTIRFKLIDRKRRRNTYT